MIFDFIRKISQNEVRIEVNHVENCIFLRAIKGYKILGKLNALIETEDKVLLADIDNEDCINQGVGSMLIERFEEICNENEIKEIHGNLAKTDIGHKDRLIHFYQKHGYSISEESDKDTYWGKIVKRL